MPEHRKVYSEIPSLSPREIEAAVHGGDLDRLRIVPLSAALGSLDQSAAEALCRDLSTHPDAFVRGNAILGLGEIARIHRALDEAAARPLIEAALHDPDEFVRGQADCAADDVEFFLGWKLKRSGDA